MNDHVIRWESSDMTTKAVCCTCGWQSTTYLNVPRGVDLRNGEADKHQEKA